MQTTVEKITPAVASKMLDSNTVNRPITKSWVNSLTDAMVRGEWKLNGEAIKIASTDQLLDGQHRLLALIAASERGVSHIETLVVRGLPPPVFDTIDQGKKRSAADIFSIAGEKHSSTLAAAVRGIFCCVHARFGGNVSMQQLEAVLPMDSLQATIDATGAAMKAILEAENAGKGMAAHPRSGDLSFPSFRKEGCTQCKRCTVECPFGAINEDEKGYPQYNESRCRRCGTCMGACPVHVISFENYSVDSVGQQIKSVDMPDEFSEKPRILVLASENDAYPALDMAAQNQLAYSAFARGVPVRCLGSVNTIWLTDALNSGYDGVVLSFLMAANPS